ncbi:hypothetical protein G7Y89_g14712 [Cudoniella acicularis]|uniref:Uncharacterized protein n=1 Tax=Cudoniella acicularis TaxID=354080 RepID=A0A8H4QZK2_9HELO|nr:hypothetical protein G7Y89_g14712 [Cudoniella acicularis]
MVPSPLMVLILHQYFTPGELLEKSLSVFEPAFTRNNKLAPIYIDLAHNTPHLATQPRMFAHTAGSFPDIKKKIRSLAVEISSDKDLKTSQKATCKQCGKRVARLRSHHCPPPKPAPHPQLSTYFNIDDHDWRLKCPLEFEYGIKELSSLDEQTISLWNGRPPTLRLSKVRPSEETIYSLVLSTIHKSSNYQVLCDGEEPPELGSQGRASQFKRSTKSELGGKKFRMAATALYQAIATPPRHPIYSILNVWPPDKSEILMQPPQKL